MKNPSSSSPRILIVKPSSLGDILHTLPLLRTLRAAHPSAFIAWIVEGAFQEVLEGDPDIDEVIVVRTKKWRREFTLATAREIGDVLRRLRKERFDIAIDLQGLVKSGVMAWLSGAKTRVGFHRADMREPVNALFMNRNAERARTGKHAVERGLALLEPLGIRDMKLEYGYRVSEADAESARIFFEEHEPRGPLVALNAGYGFPTKAWALEKYAALGDRLMGELGCSLLLTWGPGEREMAEEIAGKMKQAPWIPPATTIRQSAAFFQRCALFIGSDTGPMHLCDAVGVKCLVLMGPTEPARNGPFGPGHRVIQKDLPCKNCYKRRCDTVECMKRIEVEEVFEAASAMLAGKN